MSRWFKPSLQLPPHGKTDTGLWNLQGQEQSRERTLSQEDKKLVALQHLPRTEALAIFAQPFKFGFVSKQVQVSLLRVKDLDWPDVLLTNTLDEQAQHQTDQENVEHDHGSSLPSVPKPDPPKSVSKSQERKAAENQMKCHTMSRTGREETWSGQNDQNYVSEAMVHSCNFETAVLLWLLTSTHPPDFINVQ